MEPNESEMKVVGYCLFRNIKYKNPTLNPTKWQSGYQVDQFKKRIYPFKDSAIDAMAQFKKHRPNDDIEIVTLYVKVSEIPKLKPNE